MKNSKKTNQILKKLNNIKDLLDYYSASNQEILRDLNEIEKFIINVALLNKKEHIKIANSVKKKLVKE